MIRYFQIKTDGMVKERSPQLFFPFGYAILKFDASCIGAVGVSLAFVVREVTFQLNFIRASATSLMQASRSAQQEATTKT